MTNMTHAEALDVLQALASGASATIPTLAVFRAAAALPTGRASEQLLEEVYRRRSVDLAGFHPIRPKLSARLRALAEGQPEPPTYPAPGMTYGFPECPRWPEDGCDYDAVLDALADPVSA